MTSLLQRFKKENVLVMLFAVMISLTGGFIDKQSHVAFAQENRLPIPTAILVFEDRGEAKEEAASISELLFAKLIVSEQLALVERQALNKVLDELKLSKAGVVRVEEANQVGKLTGAKLLICGSALRVQGDLYVIAKVIGTETSRLTGASVKGGSNANLDELISQLAKEINQVVADKADTLLPKVVSTEDWIASTKKLLSGKELPSVTVKITERHMNQATFDPAAQTECERLLTALGFTVIAADTAQATGADLRIQGEAISEFAARHGELISVKCRLEAKAVSQSDSKVLASDSETTISIDLAEQLAAKSGLQEAARKMFERILLKLVK